MIQNKFQNLDKAKFVKAYNDTKKYPNLIILEKIFDASDFSIKKWAKKLRDEGYELIDRRQRNKTSTPDGKQVDKLHTKIQEIKLDHEKQLQEQRNEILSLKQAPPLTLEERIEVKKFKEELGRLQKDLREAERQALTSENLKRYIFGGGNHDFGKVPEWLETKKSTNITHGIPTLFLSDIHFDEYVDPSQINFVNEYDREIATKRIQHTFNTSIDILFNRTKNPKYDGMVIALGGDLLSGNIHEELAETNEDSIMRSLLFLTDLLIDGIDLHLKHFDKIFVPCVVGNHGRLHKKPRAKNKIFDNFEWLVYQFLARHFKDDKRVTFLIPDGPDAIFKIYGKGFLLTHGDQFRGGNAIAGIFSPLMLGFHRKQKKQSSINRSFDVMMVAHFHQYIHTNQLVINGSIKGYDEYANLCNFAFERPQQSLFINHPENGMVFRTPILCDSYKDKTKGTNEKVVIFK